MSCVFVCDRVCANWIFGKNVCILYTLFCVHMVMVMADVLCQLLLSLMHFVLHACLAVVRVCVREREYSILSMPMLYKTIIEHCDSFNTAQHTTIEPTLDCLCVVMYVFVCL